MGAAGIREGEVGARMCEASDRAPEGRADRLGQTRAKQHESICPGLTFNDAAGKEGQEKKQIWKILSLAVNKEMCGAGRFSPCSVGAQLFKN